jgi:hypothetical protein
MKNDLTLDDKVCIEIALTSRLIDLKLAIDRQCMTDEINEAYRNEIDLINGILEREH